MGNSTRTSRRSFMGDGARRGAELAVEMAGLAAGLKPVAQLADITKLAPEATAVVTRSADYVEMLDRRDTSGKNRVTARSTSELLRRRTERAILDGPSLAVALAWALGLSWQRAQAQGQPAGPSMDYAVTTIRAAVVGHPAVDVMLERMSGLAAATSIGAAAAAGPRLTAEADRLATDVASRHRSAAEQAARRLISSTDQACDLLLVGDGSRTIGGGSGTTTAAVAALDGADRLGTVLVAQQDDDPSATAWMLADLAQVGIAATPVHLKDGAALLASGPSMRILLATAVRTPDGQVLAPVGSADLVASHVDRALAVTSAFGERTLEPSHLPSERLVRADSVVG